MKLESQDSPLNFKSLSEIMEYFHKVPYDQFQKELNNWFARKMKEGSEGLTEEDREVLPDLSHLSDLISKIYHQAEVMTVLSDSKITLNND